MRTLQLLFVALGLVTIAACNRAEAEREARETADEIRTAAAGAGERLADSWLSTKVQAQFFADDDIKGRYINVTSQDGVVTLKGHVESEQVRQQALQIAQNTDGVRQVSDQLLVGQPTNAFEATESGSTATSGADDWLAPGNADAGADDERIETAIQAKFFRDTSIKARDITVDSQNGVVTLRGSVGSDSERAQALILARMSEGVQRVEDALTVDASLAPSTPTGTTGVGDQGSGIRDQGSAVPRSPSSIPDPADMSAQTRIREQLTADAQLEGSQIDVSVKDGVVLIQGTVPDQASKQRALTMARQAEGVVQVVDRLTVAGK